ncbi:MAG: hypothetical protein AAFQ98_22980, partial [Bacteroidota bacterium]
FPISIVEYPTLGLAHVDDMGIIYTRVQDGDPSLDELKYRICEDGVCEEATVAIDAIAPK